MVDLFEKNSFILQETNFRDIDLYQREDIALVVLRKFKNDIKAFRVAANHLDPEILGELDKVLTSLDYQDDIKAVIITSGHKVAFSRGAKIEIMLDADSEECRAFITGAQNFILKIQRLKKPVIAAINGLALGGGLELAMACDYRVLSDRENVVFGLPEASLGVIPGMGGTQNLSRLIGGERAMSIISEIIILAP